MKKNYLFTGIGFVLAGMILLGIALFTETRLESLLCGFTASTINTDSLVKRRQLFTTSHPIPERIPTTTNTLIR